MGQLKNVILFELNSYFKNKSYKLMTILITVALIGVISFPTIKNALGFGEDKQEPSSSQTTEEQGKDEEKDLFVIYDPSGVISDMKYISEAYGMYRFEMVSSINELKNAVTEGKAQAGYNIKSATEYSYVVNNSSMYDSNSSMFQEILSHYLRYNYMSEHNINAAEFEQVINHPIVVSEEILGKDSVGSYWYTYILVFVVYMMIMFYGQMIAVSVTTEKSNRAIEVLVTSTKTSYLIFGKVIAGAIASFIQVGVIIGAGLITYKLNGAAWDGALDGVLNIPPEVLVTFFVFLVFGFLFYSFLYGALGALVSKTEDISKATGPVMIVFIIGFFLAMMGLQDSDGTLVKVCSFIPFTSSYMMIIRVAMGSVHIIEIIISFLILIATSCATGVIGAKVYRMATLHYGNPLKLSVVLKRVFKHEE